MALKGDWSGDGNLLPTFKEQVISLSHNVFQGLENSGGLPSAFNWFTEVYNP